MKTRELRVTKSAEFERMATNHVVANDIETPNATIGNLAVTADAFVQGNFIVGGSITSGSLNTGDINGTGTFTNTGDCVVRSQLLVSNSSY